MLSLEQFINENYKSTNSNEERKKELENWLKGKNYPDYVKTLNRMLEDPKAKTLLQDGFGGKLGNMKFTYSVKNIPASALIPTQSEIDIDKSIKHGLQKPNSVKNDYSEPIIVQQMPLITFRGNYVIDGHHRWAEVMAINPNGEMICFDYDANISIIAMLKAVQGTIAAVIADKNDNEGKLPSSTVKHDVFAMSEQQIADYVDENITEEVIDYIISKQNTPGINNKAAAMQFVCNNIIDLQANNYPESGMPNRSDMPQTDKAGKDRSDKLTSLPNQDGSALNKLKDGKIDKDVL